MFIYKVITQHSFAPSLLLIYMAKIKIGVGVAVSLFYLQKVKPRNLAIFKAQQMMAIQELK